MAARCECSIQPAATATKRVSRQVTVGDKKCSGTVAETASLLCTAYCPEQPEGPGWEVEGRAKPNSRVRARAGPRAGPRARINATAGATVGATTKATAGAMAKATTKKATAGATAGAARQVTHLKLGIHLRQLLALAEARVIDMHDLGRLPGETVQACKRPAKISH